MLKSVGKTPRRLVDDDGEAAEADVLTSPAAEDGFRRSTYDGDDDDDNVLIPDPSSYPPDSFPAARQTGHRRHPQDSNNRSSSNDSSRSCNRDDSISRNRNQEPGHSEKADTGSSGLMDEEAPCVARDDPFPDCYSALEPVDEEVCVARSVVVSDRGLPSEVKIGKVKVKVGGGGGSASGSKATPEAPPPVDPEVVRSASPPIGQTEVSSELRPLLPPPPPQQQQQQQQPQQEQQQQEQQQHQQPELQHRHQREGAGRDEKPAGDVIKGSKRPKKADDGAPVVALEEARDLFREFYSESQPIEEAVCVQRSVIWTGSAADVIVVQEGTLQESSGLGLEGETKRPQPGPPPVAAFSSQQRVKFKEELPTIMSGVVSRKTSSGGSVGPGPQPQPPAVLPYDFEGRSLSSAAAAEVKDSNVQPGTGAVHGSDVENQEQQQLDHQQQHLMYAYAEDYPAREDRAFKTKIDSSYEGWDNPFRPEGEISHDAEEILRLWKMGKLNGKNLNNNESSKQADNSPATVSVSATTVDGSIKVHSPANGSDMEHRENGKNQQQQHQQQQQQPLLHQQQPTVPTTFEVRREKVGYIQPPQMTTTGGSTLDQRKDKKKAKNCCSIM